MTRQGKRSIGCTLYALMAVVSSEGAFGAYLAERPVPMFLFIAYCVFCLFAVAVFSYDDPIKKPKEVDAP